MTTNTITVPERTTLTVATILVATVLALAAIFVLPYQASAALLTQELDLGESNSDVTSLQTFLASLPNIYPEGLITGYFGSLTQAAVVRFQTANGISAVGRVGPQTLAAINAQMGGGGSTGGGSGDISAPTINPETLTTTSNSFTLSWATSESAKSRVMYGTVWPFLYSTAPSVSTSGYGATSNITITGLQSHTTYYYVLESIDGSGNVMWTVGKPVTTQ